MMSPPGVPGHRPRHARRRVLRLGPLVSLLLLSCTSGPPPPTPQSERARILQTFERDGLTGAAVQDAYNTMVQWPGDGNIREVYGRMLYEAGHLTDAEDQTTRAIRLRTTTRPVRAWAFYTQARIEMARQHWAEAAARCTDALAIQPDARWEVLAHIRLLQAQVQRSAPLAAWATHTTRHFVFHFPVPSSRAPDMAAYVREMGETQDAAVEALAAQLELTLGAPIQVFLHDTEEGLEQMLGRPGPTWDLQARTIHEAPAQDDRRAIARIATTDLGEHLVNCPPITDGAVAFVVDSAESNAEFGNPAELFGGYASLSEPERVSRARALVAFLLDHYGRETFAALWDRLAWEPLPAAVQTVYGVPLADLGHEPDAG